MSCLARLAAPPLFLAVLAGCVPPVDGTEFSPVQNLTQAVGGFREDRAARDVPFTNAELATNFSRIAFGVEEEFRDVSAQGPEMIRRWEMPIRWTVTSRSPRAEDQAQTVSKTFDRLSAATGLDIAEAPSFIGANFIVTFAGTQDYAAEADRWRELAGASGIADFIDRFATDPTTPCQGVFFFSRSDNAETGRRLGSIRFALVIIRDALPETFRQVCAEEELAQTLGLANDDPRVRPSVFNDDQEFAFLTEHDEYLLRILYDPRLGPGVGREDAMAIVPDIIEELRPGG
ncbi:MAG: DUF2927 domain-containing protein [Pseudomonadota bacterium]